MQKLQRSSSQKDVTLSMEVCYPFHSHLIGRSGENINRVMEKTGTRIHFPDQNRIVGQKKSNQVVVRGQPADVEAARQHIRSSVPVEFMVECQNESVESMGQSSLATHFSVSFGVLVRFYPRIDGVSCQVNMRGSQDKIDRLKEAVAHFCYITRTVLDSVMLKMETSFDHVWLVRDHAGRITEKTGAGIRCPDLSNLKNLPKRYSIWIRGSLGSVYTASMMLTGFLPVQLSFEAASPQLEDHYQEVAEEMDIVLHAESSSIGSVHFRASTFEKNVANLYELWRLCSSQSTNAAVKPKTPPCWDMLDDHRDTFVSAAQTLLQKTSGVPPARLTKTEKLTVEIPRKLISPIPTASSSPVEADRWIPASLSAARFDLNSFRHLSQLLLTLGLPHYIDLFLMNEVDLALFTTLTNEDFISIGITAFGARKIMLSAIQELKN